MKKRPKTEKKPFFARFLEAEQLDKATGGRPPFVTLKWPSDDDEGGVEI